MLVIYIVFSGACASDRPIALGYTRRRSFTSVQYGCTNTTRDRERESNVFFVVSLAIKTTGSNLPAISGDLFVLIENLQASSGPTNNLNK